MQRFDRFQAGDFILDLQLASFHFGDFKAVCPRMGNGLFDLILQRLVAPLELCKMRFHGHSRLLFLKSDRKSLPQILFCVERGLAFAGDFRGKLRIAGHRAALSPICRRRPAWY